VDSDKLARALADRFRRIVPEGFFVWEADGVESRGSASFDMETSL
jgi:hypothetical protein